MQASNDTDSRLIELEIKVSFSEDLLEELNRTIFRQQQQIDQLRQAIDLLCQQSPDADSASARTWRDELPPHY